MHLSRESSYGWAVRLVHSNGASAVFGAMYAHAVRGWLYALVPTVLVPVWILG